MSSLEKFGIVLYNIFSIFCCNLCKCWYALSNFLLYILAYLTNSMVHFDINCKSNLAHVWYTFVNFGTIYYNMVSFIIPYGILWYILKFESSPSLRIVNNSNDLAIEYFRFLDAKISAIEHVQFQLLYVLIIY